MSTCHFRKKKYWQSIPKWSKNCVSQLSDPLWNASLWRFTNVAHSPAWWSYSPMYRLVKNRTVSAAKKIEDEKRRKWFKNALNPEKNILKIKTIDGASQWWNGQTAKALPIIIPLNYSRLPTDWLMDKRTNVCVCVCARVSQREI